MIDLIKKFSISLLTLPLSMISTIIILFLVGNSDGDAFNNSNNNAFAQEKEIEWKNYTNTKFNFTLQYPSWSQLTEKLNRFETTKSDVQILSNIDLQSLFMFSFSRLEVGTNGMDLKQYGDSYYAEISTMGSTIEYPTIIKNKIGGEDTYTFVLLTSDTESEMPFGMQQWVMIHNGVGYNIDFMATTDTFDSDHLTKIREHMIKSFRWLN